MRLEGCLVGDKCEVRGGTSVRLEGCLMGECLMGDKSKCEVAYNGGHV